MLLAATLVTISAAAALIPISTWSVSKGVLATLLFVLVLNGGYVTGLLLKELARKR